MAVETIRRVARARARVRFFAGEPFDRLVELLDVADVETICAAIGDHEPDPTKRDALRVADLVDDVVALVLAPLVPVDVDEGPEPVQILEPEPEERHPLRPFAERELVDEEPALDQAEILARLAEHRRRKSDPEPAAPVPSPLEVRQA